MSHNVRPGTLWSVVLGLLLAAGVWSAILLENAHDEHTERQNAERWATNLATVFEKHVSDSLAAVDQSLLYLRDGYAAQGHINERFKQHVLSRVFPGAILQISVLDREGNLAYSSISDKGGSQHDFSGHDYFQFQRNARDDTLYISRPLEDRLTGKWVIQCVRKFESDGQFAGVIVVSLDALHFLDVHAALDVGQEGAISLVGMDRIIRARVSHAGTRSLFFGQEMPLDRPFFDPMQPSAGIYVARSSVDGVVRLGAWKRLPNAPLVVLVLLSENEIFASHRTREIGSYWVGIVLTLILLGGAGLIGVLLNRNAEATKALEKQATTDALTGLANRRQFYARLTDEFERARRYDRPLAVIMLDIDFFKSVNDTYGHAAGDEVLRTLADRCSRSLRKQDLIGRVGGEEFCVMLPETTEAAAINVAGGLRELIGGQGIGVGHGQTTAVTASFGVASTRREDRILETLLSRADAALYAAKEAGRNRVLAHSAIQPQEPGTASTGTAPDKTSFPPLRVVGTED